MCCARRILRSLTTLSVRPQSTGGEPVVVQVEDNTVCPVQQSDRCEARRSVRKGASSGRVHPCISARYTNALSSSALGERRKLSRLPNTCATNHISLPAAGGYDTIPLIASAISVIFREQVPCRLERRSWQTASFPFPPGTGMWLPNGYASKAWNSDALWISETDSATNRESITILR